MLDFISDWSLTFSSFVLLLGAGAIAFFGTKLAKLADQFADITGLGEAITGTLFLGLITALPGISASITTAYVGLPQLTTSNALGGIAIQTAFLAIADLCYQRTNLEHAAASLENLVQTSILILLLIICLAAFSGPQLEVFHFSAWTLLLIACAVAGLFIVNQSRAQPMWRPDRTLETVQDIPWSDLKGIRISSLLTKLGLSAIIVLFSGALVARAAERIAELSGLSQTFVGGLILAVTTSLPELVTTIAAVRHNALTLAVSNIVGGNFFDCLFLAIGDLSYLNGSIFHAPGISYREIFLVALCLCLNVTLLLGLLIRQKKGPANVGIESLMIVLVYLGGSALLYFVM